MVVGSGYLQRASLSSLSQHSIRTPGPPAVTCKKGGDVVTRHNRLRDVFVDFCHLAILGVQVEVGSTLTSNGSRSHPADAMVHEWIADRFAAFDFTVSSPLSVASLNQACTTSGSTPQAAEAHMHRANDPKCIALMTPNV